MVSDQGLHYLTLIQHISIGSKGTCSNIRTSVVGIGCLVGLNFKCPVNTFKVISSRLIYLNTFPRQT